MPVDMLTLVEENETRWKVRFIRKQKVLIRQSCPTLCDPWTVVFQVPLSMEFSRQEYWSEDPFPSLQGLFPTQQLNLGLVHCRQILGSPESLKCEING